VSVEALTAKLDKTGAAATYARKDAVSAQCVVQATSTGIIRHNAATGERLQITADPTDANPSVVGGGVMFTR